MPEGAAPQSPAGERGLFVAVIFASCFVFVWWLNRRAVERLNRRSAELLSWEERI
jgi:hypothetical protein